ncbi:MAG: glucokinase [candidate division Zixibacteria bacterium]|nr:glucokinase [candidate division Zixibacteria bacterium]
MLAGYVTSKSTRLATVTRPKGEIHLNNQVDLNNTANDFESLVRRYLRNQDRQSGPACFAVSGPIYDNSSPGRYLPWPIDGQEIADRLPFSQVRLVNEHIAAAQGLFELKPDRFYTLNEGNPIPNANKGLVTINNSLDETMIVYDGERYSTFVTESPHAGFAPGNQLETELWQYLYAEHSRVEVGDIVSRRGLNRIFRFVSDSGHLELPNWFQEGSVRTGKIVELALAGENETAEETLDIFIDCLASEAADLALRGMTLGGIYLSGSIVSEIVTVLDKGFFMERFTRRGEMEERLLDIPVHVVLEQRTPLIGAACIALGLQPQ